jgi:hypothetical protein
MEPKREKVELQFRLSILHGGELLLHITVATISREV